MVDLAGKSPIEQRAMLQAAWDRGASLTEIGAIEQAILEARAPKQPGTLKPAALSTPRIAAPKIMPCVHLGAKRERVNTSCKGCGGGTTPIKHQSYECAIFKRCIPGPFGEWGKEQLGLEEKWYHICHSAVGGKCERYEPAASLPGL